MLSIVIPAYNEEKMILKTTEVVSGIMEREKIPFELVFVNDGSKDQTWEMIEKAAEKNSHVTVMTYHASKGLEFDRVYLPNLEYGKVPHGRMLTLQELEEERRMFYVALTRAKESLWLLHDKSQTVSPFLEELKNTEKKR